MRVDAGRKGDGRSEGPWFRTKARIAILLKLLISTMTTSMGAVTTSTVYGHAMEISKRRACPMTKDTQGLGRQEPKTQHSVTTVSLIRFNPLN